MLDRVISDLETGDVFRPLEYLLTAEMVLAYLGGIGEAPIFHPLAGQQRMVRPPTMVHLDKLKILALNCPMEYGVDPAERVSRLHYEYSARAHCIGYAGERFVVTGKVEDRYIRRDRTYLLCRFEVTTDTGRAVAAYDDRTVLGLKRVSGDA